MTYNLAGHLQTTTFHYAVDLKHARQRRPCAVPSDLLQDEWRKFGVSEIFRKRLV